MNILNEEKITKEQKYAMFDGVDIKNAPFAKKFKNNYIIVTVDGWKMSGKAISDKKGLLSMLAVYTNKQTGKPHYYFDNYSVSYANNFKYIDQVPITSDSAKAFVKSLGGDISKLKDFDDSANAVDFKIDKLTILKEQNIISFKDFILI